MNTIMICLVVFIVICIVLIWYINVYNHYQTYIIRINEAEAFIDTTLRKRFDLLNKSIGIIKGNLTNKKEEVLEISETFLKIELGLFESESEIVAARKYYNDIITDYNKLVRRFPSTIVAKLSGYKLKTYFDGKDMNDEIIKDFKLI